jgi:hypothetical protein
LIIISAICSDGLGLHLGVALHEPVPNAHTQNELSPHLASAFESPSERTNPGVGGTFDESIETDLVSVLQAVLQTIFPGELLVSVQFTWSWYALVLVILFYYSVQFNCVGEFYYYYYIIIWKLFSLILSCHPIIVVIFRLILTIPLLS